MVKTGSLAGGDDNSLANPIFIQQTVVGQAAEPSTTNVPSVNLRTHYGWDLEGVGSAGDNANGVRELATGQMLANGGGWDAQRNNVTATLLASAARTTTQSAEIVNYNGRFIDVVLDMTVVGTGSVTVTINGKDGASGKYSLLLTGAAITTNSTNRYRVGPGLPATANVSANDMLPRTLQIVVTANNANSATYSVGYDLSV